MTIERERRESGFTLLEAAIATALFTVLAGAFFAIANSSMRARAEQDSVTGLLTYASHATAAMQADLRETGRVTLTLTGGGQKTYPAYVPASGGTATAIVFVLPKDMDGDGLPTSATTGQIEWGPTEYQFAVQPASGGGNQLVRLVGGSPSKVLLARNVEHMEVYDAVLDATLALNQLRVRLFLVATDPQGGPLSVTVEAVITMPYLRKQAYR